MARARKPDDRKFLTRLAGGASERVLKVVDPNQVLEQIDVDNLLDRVDVNALLDRVEPDQILDRVDVNRLLERVDLDALLARVDVKALVDRAGIPEIVADSTSHLTGSALDLVRRPLVGLDEIIFRTLNRVIRRDPGSMPSGPGQLVEWVDEKASERKGVKTGRYAGPLTRLLAVALDTLLITTSFTLMVGLAGFLVGLFGGPEELALSAPVYGVLIAIWGFLYHWTGIALAGKTLGKAVLGLRVVTADGDPALHRREPLIRVLTMPLSYLAMGLGLLGVVFGRERRAWHDLLAGTAVVYDWGSRTATMPTPLATFLERRDVDVAVDEE